MDARKKIIEMTGTATGSMTVITGTTTIGTTAKITPIAGIFISGTESTGPLLKCARKNKGRTGSGATTIRITTTAASRNVEPEIAYHWPGSAPKRTAPSVATTLRVQPGKKRRIA